VESDVEAEKILHGSKIHEHMKEMLRHLYAEDNAWYSRCLVANVHINDDSYGRNGGGDGDDYSHGHDMPCFTTFLRGRYMDELCSRARQDRPRGSLHLVLVIVTSILRRIRYPLLPHQSVHKPLYQLIRDASSISSMYNSISKSKQSPSRDFATYVKKLDSQLVHLISALWAKIADNMDVLDCFIFEDKRDGVKRHFDAISCLIPLMGKPKIGAIAKEALLISIGMHDPRVDSFVLHNTNLKANIIGELTKKFKNCVAILTINFKPEHFTAGTTLPVHKSSEATNEEKIMFHAVESFVKVLHFCAAVVSSGSTSSISSSRPSTPNAIRPAMVAQFASVFLPTVKSCLLENGEEHVLAAQFLVRRLLHELFEAPTKSDITSGLHNCNAPDQLIAGISRSTNPLCVNMTNFICNDDVVLQLLFRRVGSVSRPVSVSSMQLLSSLLMTCSLPEGHRLVIAGSNDTSLRSSSLGMVRNNVKLALDSFIMEHIISYNDNVPDEYSTTCLNIILGKLAMSDISLLHLKQVSVESGPIFSISCNKLQKILSLQYDEQLSVTGLVIKCVIELIGCLIFVSTEDELECGFKMLSALFETRCKIAADLLSLQENIPDVDVKLKMIREVLAAPIECSHESRKYVDSENYQIVRILESSVIVDELGREMEGGLLAFRQLIYSLSDCASLECPSDTQEYRGLPPVLSQSDIVPSIGLIYNEEDTWSTDDESGEVDCCNENHVLHDIDHEKSSSSNERHATLPLTNHTVDVFLAECNDMEIQLDQILATVSVTTEEI